jgi:hypothetical protein
MTKAIATTEEEFGTMLPAHIQAQMDKGTQRGSEDVSSDDLTIPRLQIIQALSPQKKKTNAAYIDGAEEGQIFNTATEQLYTDGMFIVPVYFRKEFLIWTKERTDNNGFRGSYPTELEAVKMLKELEDGHLCEISDTHQQFCLVVDPKDKSVQEVVMSMAKSQIKISKRFNTQIRLAGGDRFNMVYKFSVVDDKSDKGEFYNWGFKKQGYCPEWAYAKAEAMYEAVKSGERNVKMDDAPKAEKTVNEVDESAEFPDEM